MISNILLAVFCVAILANVIALYRHWQALRMFNMMLQGFAESQEQFNELMAKEKDKP